VDGEPHVTCTIPAESASGRRVVTLAGTPAPARARLARAFVHTGAVQCGFCVPGILLRAYHLLERQPNATRAEIAAALDEHLCRCTGYTRILDAIELAAREGRGEPPAVTPPGDGVGAPAERLGAHNLALGERPFVEDLARPGMLFGAVRLSDHPRALIRRIDTSRARALPGVVAVLTAQDVPGDRWYGLIEHDWPGFVAVDEETRCVGDVLATVAAVDEVTARAAAALVEVDAEVLPPVLDPEAALAPGAARVHPAGENLLSRSIVRNGDAEKALATSAHVVSGTWRTQRIEHYFLEPECALAEPEPHSRMHLWSQGQGIFDDRRQVASFLGISEVAVFVEQVGCGGAFGGKEDLTVQAHAALLALRTGCPVRLSLDRRESIRTHPKRHPITIQLTAGCDAEGRLTAVRARLVGDTGAYASVGAKVLERAAGHAAGPYRVPHVDIEALAVRTNNPPCGAMRGFGVPQVTFAIEGALDRLAARAGIDRWEIRWRNAVAAGDTLANGQRLEASVGLKATLEAVKPRWDEARSAGRAVGIACGFKNSGLGNGAVEFGRTRLHVEHDGTITLFHGYSDMGQGLPTALAQIAAEVTGLPAARFRPRVDTRFPLDCGQTTGSRATLLGGRAVRQAAERLRADLDQRGSLAALFGGIYAGEVRVNDTTALGAPIPHPHIHTAYGFATQLCVLDSAGRLERMVAAHDVGRAINPVLCRSQIEGSLHMGLGYALSEELPCADGMPVTFSRYQLGILRARDMPELEVMLIEDPAPEGPFGAKGLGEIGLVPTAAAVAGALEAFDGTRHMTLPMKDSPAARALSVGRIRTKVPREAWR
jgi:xanthine dehydrogenase molybdenum-binding subunit